MRRFLLSRITNFSTRFHLPLSKFSYFPSPLFPPSPLKALIFPPLLPSFHISLSNLLQFPPPSPFPPPCPAFRRLLYSLLSIQTSFWSPFFPQSTSDFSSPPTALQSTSVYLYRLSLSLKAPLALSLLSPPKPPSLFLPPHGNPQFSACSFYRSRIVYSWNVSSRGSHFCLSFLFVCFLFLLFLWKCVFYLFSWNNKNE